MSVSDELSEARHARTSLSPALTWQPRLLLVAPVISDCPPCVELEIKTAEKKRNSDETTLYLPRGVKLKGRTRRFFLTSPRPR